MARPSPTSPGALTADGTPATASGGVWVRTIWRRAWAGVTGAVGIVSGIAPHVLHHAGPIAGAALVTGTGGSVLFGAVGLAVSVPFLLRLRRRFGTRRAPVVALAVFAAAFTLSTLVIGPAIRGGGGSAATPLERPAGDTHDEHGH